MQRLWEAMPLWEPLGSEVAVSGYPGPDWVRSQALDKLVPQEMLTTIIGRPELANFKEKLCWVKNQMEHARGASQAWFVQGEASRGGGGVKDMDIGELTGGDGTSDAISGDSVT
jgi:hypothetical protein